MEKVISKAFAIVNVRKDFIIKSQNVSLVKVIVRIVLMI